MELNHQAESAQSCKIAVTLKQKCILKILWDLERTTILLINGFSVTFCSYYCMGCVISPGVATGQDSDKNYWSARRGKSEPFLIKVDDGGAVLPKVWGRSHILPPRGEFF